jgi:hypothetical protein
LLSPKLILEKKALTKQSPPDNKTVNLRNRKTKNEYLAALAELLEGKTVPWPAQPRRRKIYT